MNYGGGTDNRYRIHSKYVLFDLKNINELKSFIGLDNLPAEVQHYLAEIRDKENKILGSGSIHMCSSFSICINLIQEIQSRIQARMSSYLRHASRAGGTLSHKDTALPEQVALEHAKVMTLAEEKLQCAEKIVKLVSRALGRLDVDLARALDRTGESVATGPANGTAVSIAPAGSGGASNVMGWMSDSITLGSTGAMGFGLGLGRAGAVTDALRGALADGSSSSSTGAGAASLTATPHPPKRVLIVVFCLLLHVIADG